MADDRYTFWEMSSDVSLEVKKEDVRIVLCCVVYNYCTQCYAHTCEQLLNLHLV